MTFSSLCSRQIETVLGVQVHLLDDYLAWLERCYKEGTGTHVVTLNAEMVMLARKNPQLASAIAQADLVIPDGAGVVLALRLQGKKQQRYAGIELGADLMANLAKNGAAGEIFFYGGERDRAATAAQNWRDQYPQLSIHTQHGYLSAAEETELCEELQAKQPHLILVGLGVPRQEIWIAQHRHLCPHSIWIGIGGAFDIWAGAKPRAPQWFCQHNLEWLYRLYQEPSRWQRMLVLPQFAWTVLTKGNEASQ